MKKSLPRMATIRLLFLTLFVLSACSTPAVQPTATRLPSATPLPTATATALPTPAPTDTAVPPTETAASLPTQTTAAPEAPAFGEIALLHIQSLEAVAPRITGTQAETRAADYIREAFKQMGYLPETQEFSFTPEDGPESSSANVIAVKTGDSPQEIIIGAHYDSVDVGRGADDNASGVAVMLEIAQRVQSLDTPYTLRFIAFGAEEAGLFGSEYYVDQMSQDEIENTVAMVNLDSLVAGEIAYVYGDEGEEGVLREWILQKAEELGLTLQTQPGENPDYPAGTTCDDCSDHAYFIEQGIPYAYFESTNWSLGDKDGYTQVDLQYGEEGEIWHTQFDTLEYIEATFPGRVAERLNLFATLLFQVATEYR